VFQMKWDSSLVLATEPSREAVDIVCWRIYCTGIFCVLCSRKKFKHVLFIYWVSIYF
jgi:hypothetical protein